MNVFFVIAGVVMVFATNIAITAMTEPTVLVDEPRRVGLAVWYLIFSSALGGLLVALHGLNSLGG